MQMDVKIFPHFKYFLNIDIYPSPSETSNIEGLCGDLNGDENDDFKLRDSSRQGTRDEFALSWG